MIRAADRLTLLLILGGLASAWGATRPENLFGNESFEEGTGYWSLDRASGTVGRLSVGDDDARDGRRSARVAIGKVASWGTQFGQTLEAGEKGKTYTFAVLAKSAGGPVKADLQIERRGKPWDRAARSKSFTLTRDTWTELHVTFTVATDFPQGWFAYLSCTQPNCEYRADAFRLYEGDYIPYETWREMAAVLPASHGVEVLDTVRSSAPIRGDTLKTRPAWRTLPEGSDGHAFSGGAVLTNGRIALAFRREAAGAELYAYGPDGPALRATLAPAESARLSALKVVANDPSAATLEATYRMPEGAALVLRHRLSVGQVFVETEPVAGATSLRVTAPCRYAVLPDFFADDIVVDATAIKASRAELPSENFLLHLVGRGEAVVMAVWSVRDKDVAVELSGEGAKRRIDTSIVHFGKKGKIWTAALEAKGAWHHRDLAAADAGKILRLDWRQPFPAMWRVDWRTDSGLVDSWEMALQQRTGRFLRPGWFGSPRNLPANRKRWTTVLGSFLYPCWVDSRGQGHLQPLKKKTRFSGPAVLYPINRVRSTPLDAFTVVDVVRGTLGVGPCQYILDVESHGESYKGRATCGTRDVINPIYARKQQKSKRAVIERALEDVDIFVRHIRGRVEDYVVFAHQMLDDLARHKKAHPELAKPIGELEQLLRQIDTRYAARKPKIKTPAYVQALTDKFRKELLDYEGADALKRCKAITSAIVVVGGNQDELVGECRMVVKWVRQRAALALAADPRMAPIARDIRARTRKILRNPTSYEAPRH